MKEEGEEESPGFESGDCACVGLLINAKNISEVKMIEGREVGYDSRRNTVYSTKRVGKQWTR